MNPVDLAVQLIKESSSLVALTGAGISTDSGIPDFRSPDGIWSRYPATLGEYTHFMANPEKFLALGRELLPTLMNAKPNTGHKALKELEDTGTLKVIITQNIDGLHQMAGSKRVIEIHGTYKTATCTKCMKRVTIDEVVELLKDIPLCPECSGIIKPDVVMFGESLPKKAFLEAKQVSEEADVLLVVGSSLHVYPASHLVLVTKQNNGSVIIINDAETGLDRVADVIIRDTISACLPQMVEKLKKEAKL
jgi:NAD-dependent deacetylase